MESERFIEQSPSILQPGDHLCCFFEDERQRQEALRAVLTDGLAQGRKIICLLDDAAPQVEFAAAQASGQLIITASRIVFLPDGAFQPAAVIDWVQQQANQAREEGYPALQLCCEMGWHAACQGAPHDLINFEAMLNQFDGCADTLIICLYDRRRFDPAFLLEVMRMHNRVLLGEQVVDNLYFTPPEVFFDPEPASARLDYCLSTLISTNPAFTTPPTSTEHENLYKTIFDQAGDAFFITDFNGHFLVMNQMACQLFDWSQNDMLADPNGPQVTQRYVQGSLQNISVIQDQDAIISYEMIHRTRDGRNIALEVNSREIYYAGRQALLNIARDVTERKGIEAALRSAEARYRTIFDAATDAIFITNLQGEILEVNQVACERLGHLQANLLGQSASIFDAPELASQVPVRMALIQQYGHLSYETVQVAQNGDFIPVEINARRIEFEGQPAILNIARDITERKQAEIDLVNANEALGSSNEALAATNAALRESELKFRSLIESSPDGISLADENGLFLEWNAANEAIFGIPKEQVIGCSIPEVYFRSIPEERRTPEILEALTAEVANSLVTGIWESMGKVQEREICRPDGKRRILHAIRFPIHTERGFMVGSVVRDVTEHHQTELELDRYRQGLEDMVARRTAEIEHEIHVREMVEQELVFTNEVLRESEERYRVLVNQSPAAIMVVQDARYCFINPTAAQRLGYESPFEIIGEPALSVIAPDCHRLLVERMDRAAAGGTNDPVILKYLRRDGSILFADTVSVPITYQGRPAVLVLGQDVTERMRYQQQLEASLAEKEVMLREIHHRVKNNLSVIIGLIDMQKQTQTDPTVIDVFKELQTRAYTMALVHESLYRSANLAEVDFSGYLHTLVGYLGSAYGTVRGQSPVTLQIQVEDIALGIETAIPCGLIINEFVTNALKYAFPINGKPLENCTIFVRLERVTTSVGGLLLSVHDNGVGLPPGFDWRSASTLGLQLIQVLSRQIGGRLELDLSSGTTWRLFFKEHKE